MNKAVSALLGLIALTGCAASTSGPHPTKLRTVAASFDDAGRTVELHLGDSVKVRLDSTYWQFAAPRGHVLRRVDGAVRVRPNRIPGSGAGTVTVTYQSDRLGRATITASRLSCGEAMRCRSAQRRFRLYVVVRGGS